MPLLHVAFCGFRLRFQSGILFICHLYRRYYFIELLGIKEIVSWTIMYDVPLACLSWRSARHILFVLRIFFSSNTIVGCCGSKISHVWCGSTAINYHLQDASGNRNLGEKQWPHMTSPQKGSLRISQLTPQMTSFPWTKHGSVFLVNDHFTKTTSMPYIIIFQVKICLTWWYP